MKKSGKAGTTQKKPTGGYRTTVKGHEGRTMNKGTVVERGAVRTRGIDRTVGRDARSGQYLARDDERRTPAGENSKRFSVVEARSQFAEVINQTSYGKERIILTRQGKDLAALISVEDLALFERLLEEEQDRLDIQEAKSRLSNPEETPIPYEQARKGLAIE